MRWFKATAGLLAVIMLMTGCFKIEGTIKIEDDGSGSIDYVTALNTDSVFGALGSFSELGDLEDAGIGDAQTLCDDFDQDLGSSGDFPPEAVVTPYEEDGFCGSRVQYSFPAALDHSGEVSGLFDDNTRLFKEGDNWFFDSPFDTDDITEGSDELPPAIADALLGDGSFKITLDLPGRAVDGENNATEVGSDGRFTWDIDIANPPARLFAQTEPGSGGGSGGGNLGRILIALALLAILGAAVFLFIKRRNELTSDSDTPGAVTPGISNPLPGGVTQQASANPAMPYQAAPEQAVPGQAYADQASAASPQQDVDHMTPVMPLADVSDAAKETVLMDPAEVQRLAASALSAETAAAEETPVEAATQAAAATQDAAQPVYDEALGAWTIQDPVRGRLRHDPATDTWDAI